MNHLLLSIVGNTPQVVTETLYAIHAQGKPWPGGIRIITTTVGKRGAMRLLDERILERMCAELGVPCPDFAEPDILVVPDAQGRLVDDARTVEDHEALANFIVTEVRNLTDESIAANSQRSIHASLAGGRKTMTFYLGYAMSLFGRAGDSLSHILVSQEYENLPSFFYPSRQGGLLETRDGKVLDPALAKVELADIPFIRHRKELPALLLHNPDGSGVNLRELIGWINLAEYPEQLRLTLHGQECLIEISDAQGTLRRLIEPNLLEFAFYRLMAGATCNADSGFTRPSASKPDIGWSKSICDELLQINDITPGGSLDESFKKLSRWTDQNGQLRDNTLETLKKGLTASWFDQRLTTLRKAFQEWLPVSLAEHLLPRAVWDQSGNKIAGSKKAKSGGYALALDKSQITMS